MFDTFSGYTDLCSYKTQMQMKFIRDHIREYPLYEKLLGFQREMNNKIAPIYDKKLSEITSKNITTDDKFMAEIGISTLCALNIEGLFHALKPLENNAINIAANIVRPVYESIPKIFYVLQHPEHIHIIICKESFEFWLAKKQYEDFTYDPRITKKEYFEEFLKTDGIKYDKHLKLNDTSFKYSTREFSNTWYRKQVYVDETLKFHNATYGSLSVSSHSNIRRSDITEPDSLLKKHFMKILTDLAFFNLFVYANSCHDVLTEINELEDTVKFVDSTQKELKRYLTMTYLYPNNPDYLKNLHIQPF